MKRSPLRHVSIHGHAVGYRRMGPTHPTDDTQTILLIHGLAGSSKTWDAVMPVLAEQFDVIAPDLLGHGESAKPSGDYSLGAFASGLRDFLAVLDVSTVTIVGHSFGGGVAMQLAYQYPHLLDRLVLVGSGGLGREVSWLLRLLSLPGFEYVMPLGFPKPIVDFGTNVGRFAGRRGVRSKRLAEMWRAYSSLAGAPNRSAFVRTMRGVIEPGGQTVNATIGCIWQHAFRRSSCGANETGSSRSSTLIQRMPRLNEADSKSWRGSATSHTSKTQSGSLRCSSTSC
jgi:pimeloyl-ACP methyl ester carboxylesterase